jgi:hypothetical protein
MYFLFNTKMCTHFHSHCITHWHENIVQTAANHEITFLMNFIFCLNIPPLPIVNIEFPKNPNTSFGLPCNIKRSMSMSRKLSTVRAACGDEAKKDVLKREINHMRGKLTNLSLGRDTYDHLFHVFEVIPHPSIRPPPPHKHDRHHLAALPKRHGSPIRPELSNVLADNPPTANHAADADAGERMPPARRN